MDAKIHGGLRILEIDIGGAFVIPTEGLSSEGKDMTAPLGLTLWAEKVSTNRW